MLCRVLNYTCSIGFSIAEASNFFNDGFGFTIAQADSMYQLLHKRATEELKRSKTFWSKDVKEKADNTAVSVEMFKRYGLMQ